MINLYYTMTESEFLAKVLNDIRQIAIDLINSLPNPYHSGPFGRAMRNAENTKYFTDIFSKSLFNPASRYLIKSFSPFYRWKRATFITLSIFVPAIGDPSICFIAKKFWNDHSCVSKKIREA